MAEIQFFPVSWNVNEDWSMINVLGRLENTHSVAIHLPFRPFFILKYVNTSKEAIMEIHNFLLNSCPVSAILEIPSEPGTYKVVFVNKSDYLAAGTWCQQNLPSGTILNFEGNPLVKFFCENNINPGNWQRALKLQKLSENSKNSADLIYTTQRIISIPENKSIPPLKIVFFHNTSMNDSSDQVLFPNQEMVSPDQKIQVIISWGIQNSKKSLSSADFLTLLIETSPDLLIGSDFSTIPFSEKIPDHFTQIGFNEIYIKKYPDRSPLTIKNIEELISLFNSENIPETLQSMANFWKNTFSAINRESKDALFKEWIQSSEPGYFWNNCSLGAFPTIRHPKVYRNVKVYSLSNLYLQLIKSVSSGAFEALATKVIEKFQSTPDGLIPFRSGIFPTSYSLLEKYLEAKVPLNTIVSCSPWKLQTTSTISGLAELALFDLQICTPLDEISVDSKRRVLRKGAGGLTNPTFALINKYLYSLLEQMLSKPGSQIDLSQINTDFSDFVLEMKIGPNYLPNPQSKIDSTIFEQVRQFNLRLISPWQKIRYIRTVNGPIIEQIYQKDLGKYIELLDMNYYNQIVISLFSMFVNA